MPLSSWHYNGLVNIYNDNKSERGKTVTFQVSKLSQKDFVIIHSTSPVDGQYIKLGLDNPAIKWLIHNNKCVLMKEFKRSIYYF